MNSEILVTIDKTRDFLFRLRKFILYHFVHHWRKASGVEILFAMIYLFIRQRHSFGGVVIKSYTNHSVITNVRNKNSTIRLCCYIGTVY